MNPFKKSTKQKSIFITAGYPKIDSLASQVKLLDDHSIDFIEVGIPFSDPLADGPVIQNTSEVAIKNGMNLPLIFSQLESIQTKTPLVLMGYLNPVMNYGVEKFAMACKKNDIASIILPDMSVEIYERFYQSIFEKHSVSISFLITPETEMGRVLKIAKHCEKSFVYLVSSNSTTGANSKLSFDTVKINSIREALGETPLMIGFGIKTIVDIDKVHQIADGAIIGSAYLKALAIGEEQLFLESL